MITRAIVVLALVAWTALSLAAFLTLWGTP